MKKVLLFVLFNLLVFSIFSQGWPSNNSNYSVYKNGPDLTMDAIPGSVCVGGACGTICGTPTGSAGTMITYSHFYSGTGLTISQRDLTIDFDGAKTVNARYSGTNYTVTFSISGGGYQCQNNGTSSGTDHSFTVTSEDFQWTGVVPNRCPEDNTSVNLYNYLSSSSGVTFSGPGVSGNNWSGFGLSSGTKTITAQKTFDNGTISRNINVTVYTPPTVTFSDPPDICESQGANPDLEDYVNITGGTFTENSAGLILSGSLVNVASSSPGSYPVTYTYTDGNGCANSDNATVTIDTQNTVNAGSDQSACTGAGDVTLVATTSGVSWSCVSCSYVSGGKFDATSAPVGQYTVRATKTVGACTDTDDKIFEVLALPTISVTDDTSLCGSQSIQLFGSGAGVGGSYSWTPTGTLDNANIFNPTASPTVTTTYTVTGTTADNCVSTAQVTLTISGSVDNTSVEMCINGSAQLGANGGITYLWDNAGSLDNANIDNPVATPSVNTTYTVRITNSDGCFTDKQVDVVVNPLPTANAGSNFDICNGVNGTLSGGGTGGIAGYSWSPTTGIVGSSTIQNPTINLSSNQTYTLTVTDSKGCENTDQVSVSVDTPVLFLLADNFLTSSVAICFGESTNLDAHMTGGASYAWSPSTGLTSTIIRNPIASPTNTTTYSLTVTDNNGCQRTKTIEVVVNALPTGSVSSSAFSIYNGESVQLEAFGGSTYSWTNSSSLSNGGVSNPVADPTSTTIYNVSITSIDGCSVTEQIIVTVNPLPTANAGNDVEICNGFGTELTGIGAGVGGTYSWSPSTGLNNVSIVNPIASPTTSTIYTLTITDANGRQDTDQVDVTVNNPATLTLEADNVVTVSTAICAGESTTLEAIMTNASSYSWSPSTGLSSTIVANPVASPAATTDYSVIVTDNNGCQITNDIEVVVLESIELELGDPITLCDDEEPIDLRDFTVLDDVTFSGSGIINSVQFSPETVGEGVYFITGNYESGDCLSSDVLEINVIAGSVASTSDDQTVCLGESVQLDASGGGSYSWSPAISLSNAFIRNPIATPTQTTIYTVSVVDGNGCADSKSVTVTVNFSATGAIAAESVTYTEGDLATFTFDQLSSYTIDSYVWSFGNGKTSTSETGNFYYYVEGNYTVGLDVVTSDGCESSFTYDIDVISDDEIVLGTEKNSSFTVYPIPFQSDFSIETDDHDQSIQLVSLTGKRVLEKDLTLGLNTIDASNLPSGIYFLMLLKANEIVRTSKIIMK
ncbi:MAG: T9SS type A sorting domain-containing protein [Cytophagales bacterium]|nr:T9SS type A sorting domain-containing protein [Cytophagales bacterium]